MFAIAVGCVLAAGVAVAQESGQTWGYEGDDGPAHWSYLNPDYAPCGHGQQQSPVDITSTQSAKLPSIHFDYRPGPLAIINNGHTIQANYAPGSSIVLDGKTYDLVQFHFHHVSETTLKGKHAPLEGHLVHKSKDGHFVVVSVLFLEGHANPAINTLWSNIPKEKEKESKPEGVEINANQLLPDRRAYYTFPGSLTTPPCTEGVTWLVMQKKMTVSKAQINAFAALYPDNFRPTQPLDGRVILMSKH